MTKNVQGLYIILELHEQNLQVGGKDGRQWRRQQKQPRAVFVNEFTNTTCLLCFVHLFVSFGLSQS